MLHAATLGRATPQLLTGVAFRAPFSNFHKRGSSAFKAECPERSRSAEKPLNKGDGVWQCRPFSGFVSLKFAPGTSQTLSGYVIGGTYAIGHHLNALVGFALTPIQESAPGFRIAASQFVRSEQTQGRDLNFNPDAMLRNDQNAFDGFPVTDSTGKLIYQGTPTTVHYHGGVVFGISIPVYFKSIFSSVPLVRLTR